MRTGFFKIPKAILDTVMTEPGRYCQAKAVMDIFMRTRYKDSDKAKKGEVVLSLEQAYSANAASPQMIVLIVVFIVPS